jgi:hypothetical protein
MRNNIKYLASIIAIITLTFGACQEVDPLVEELEFDRVFTPRDLEVRVRNRTTAEFTWALRADAKSYVLEIHEDSLKFTTLVKTVNVNTDQLPYSVALEGETRYSARLKGINPDTDESKWAEVTFRTESENILYEVAPDDIKATSVTLKWPAGSEVNRILLMPGNIQYQISAADKAAGSATVTGLTGETTYTAMLYRDNKQRGQTSFTTLIDLGGAIPVYPEDNLADIIAAAAAGDVLVLFPGVHSITTGDVQITKSITIKGLFPHNKPVVSVRFVLNSGVGDFHIKDLDLMGTYGETPVKLAQAIFFNSGNYTVNSVTVESCIVRSYNQALIYGGSAVLKLENLTITESILSDIVNDGGDFIDFRSGHVVNLSITNSTFNRVAAFPRDFIRLDNSSSNFPGSTTKILIDKCTFYNVSHSRRILYVRFVSNESKVTNTIFAGPEGYTGYYSNQAATTNPECSKNNYFNAPAFYTTSMKLDLSTNYTTLDPGFVNVSAGNFKVTNQTLIDNQIGDPRWLK